MTADSATPVGTAETLPVPITGTESWDAATCRPSSGSGTLAKLGRVLLLVGSTDPAAVAPLLGQAELVAANGGQGRQLVRSFALLLGTATTEVPDFVALAPHANGVAVLVQGDASVTVNGETFSGRDSLAWVERLVPFPVTSLSASVDPASAERPHLRLGDGVVEAGGLSLGARTATEVGMEAPVEVAVVVPVEPAPEAAAPTADPAPPVPPTPPLGTPTPAPPAPAPTPEPPSFAHQAPPAPAPAPPAYSVDKPVEATPTPPPPAPAAPVAAPAATPAPPPYDAGGFDAVRLDDLPDDDLGAPAPLPIVEQPSDVEDHEHTEQVRGVYCKNRHFNDPRLLFCGVCGINMVQQTPVLVSGTRPPLGVIVLDDGAVFQLDSDYLLGRDPSGDERVRSGAVRGVPVVDTSNQISRVHARLELREWDVVLVDNASTNGTFVNPPQAEGWQRLPSGGEHVLTQGTRVRIGHRTMAYNAHGH